MCSRLLIVLKMMIQHPSIDSLNVFSSPNRLKMMKQHPSIDSLNLFLSPYRLTNDETTYINIAVQICQLNYCLFRLIHIFRTMFGYKLCRKMYILLSFGSVETDSSKRITLA